MKQPFQQLLKVCRKSKLIKFSVAFLLMATPIACIFSIFLPVSKKDDKYRLEEQTRFALQRQLEKSLTEFQNIQKACVRLDIPPVGSFSPKLSKTKASVIFSLKPGERINHVQVEAIANHLAGSVRGLDPQMVAISDTTGKLYQAIGGVQDPIFTLEEEIYERIENFLSMTVGKGHFKHTIQVIGDIETKKLKTLNASILIDESFFDGKDHILKNEIVQELGAILDSYTAANQTMIDFVKFQSDVIKQRHPLKRGELWFLIFISLSLCIFFFKTRRKKIPPPSNAKSSTRVDLNKLASAICDEKPETIARIISYLERDKAQAILKLLPGQVRDAVQRLGN